MTCQSLAGRKVAQLEQGRERGSCAPQLNRHPTSKSRGITFRMKEPQQTKLWVLQLQRSNGCSLPHVTVLGMFPVERGRSAAVIHAETPRAESSANRQCCCDSPSAGNDYQTTPRKGGEPQALPHAELQQEAPRTGSLAVGQAGPAAMRRLEAAALEADSEGSHGRGPWDALDPSLSPPPPIQEWQTSCWSGSTAE